MLDGATSWLVRLRKLLGGVLIGFGAAALAGGVLAFLSDFFLVAWLAWLLGAGGLLLVGAGLLLCWPFSATVSLIAGIALLVSSVLFLALFVFKLPFPVPGALVFVAGVGVAGLLGLAWSAHRRGRDASSK